METAGPDLRILCAASSMLSGQTSVQSNRLLARGNRIAGIDARELPKAIPHSVGFHAHAGRLP